MRASLALLIILALLSLSTKAGLADAQTSGLPMGLAAPTDLSALTPEQIQTLKSTDSDNDGLSDYDEIYIYHTDPHNADTDGDGFLDGDEVRMGFDPNKAGDDRLQKEIDINLDAQTLTYSLGPYQIAKILISSGVKGLETPLGDFTILKKKPVVDYKGKNYDYKDTRWNMLFKQQAKGNLYIHGAYWHHNFGQVMSHGCVNVSYADIEPLYDWADVGTKVVIR